MIIFQYFTKSELKLVEILNQLFQKAEEVYFYDSADVSEVLIEVDDVKYLFLDKTELNYQLHFNEEVKRDFYLFDHETPLAIIQDEQGELWYLLKEKGGEL